MTEARFAQTHWVGVLDAASRHSPSAGKSLEQLCQRYWPPLYAFLRKSGHSKHDAEDLVQGFFAHLLSKDRLGKVDPAKGTFRSFLLASLNNYKRDEWDKQCAEKRGGGVKPIAIPSPDETNCWEPRADDTPAAAFDRQWASTLLMEVLDQLRQQYARNGKLEVFKILQPYLTGDSDRGDYASAAVRLQTTPGAVRVAVHRLRADFQAALRDEVARTVTSISEVDTEIRHLIRVLRPAKN